MSGRLERAESAFRQLGAEAALIANGTNRRWLTGFSGSAGVVLLMDGEAELVTDGRYTMQAAAECREGVRVVTHRGPLATWLADRLSGVRGPLAVEADHLTVAELRRLKVALPHMAWLETEGVVAGLRVIKDAEELLAIRTAFQVADQAFAAVLPAVAPGISEIELALDLEARMRAAGAGLGFDTIVVSGPRSALPHGQPTSRRLEPGDLVTVDWGATWQGYTSDATRTLAVGQLDQKGRQIYQVVKAAMEAAIAVAKDGVSARAVDAAALAVIADAGLAERFVHGTGHGVGLEVHEAPSLGARSEDILAAGMVVTFEPGIYIEGYGGVRIEQTGIITEDGAELLSRLPTDLQIV